MLHLELFNLTEASKCIPQPQSLSIELMEHQKRSICAMLELEKKTIYFDKRFSSL